MKKSLISFLIATTTVTSMLCSFHPYICNAETISTTEAPSVDCNSLSRKKIGFGIKHCKNGEIPCAGSEIDNLFNKYDGHYLGKTDGKNLYLTFDSGYENGYTEKILDALKNNNVKAAFFVTTPYMKENPNIIKRMVAEGHIVGNHTTTHPSMPTVTDFSKFEKELVTNSETFKEITGQEMPKYFRPPMGEFSELSLYYTTKLGYKSMLWSFAYKDWDNNKQMDPSVAKKTIKECLHNGEVFLLHSVSKTNAEILDSVLKDLKNEGYTFHTLDEI